MTFNDDCGIIYGKFGPPHLHAGGVNIEYECKDKIITFRKFPTGIIVLQDKCKRGDEEGCCLICPHQGYYIMEEDGIAIGNSKALEDMMSAAGIVSRKPVGGGDK